MSVHEFSVQTAAGDQLSLAEYTGKVLLIVNTASKCGFTPQYSGLENLYQKFKDKGFVVLGFPCNQFGHQEPGTNAEIQEFCTLNYHVTFPVFAKIDVNGPKADPLYQYLTKSAPGFLNTEAIKWNFTKFLVNQNGQVVNRYAPTVKPEELENDILQLLNQ